MESFMVVNRFFLLISMIFLLLNPSFLLAANDNSTQQFNKFYQNYMENVLDTLKCKTDDDSCYQKAFEQASEEGGCTPPTCSFECETQCITAGSYINFGINPQINQLCSSEKYQQICKDAAISLCKRLCNKS